MPLFSSVFSAFSPERPRQLRLQQQRPVPVPALHGRLVQQVGERERENASKVKDFFSLLDGVMGLGWSPPPPFGYGIWLMDGKLSSPPFSHYREGKPQCGKWESEKAYASLPPQSLLLPTHFGYRGGRNWD